ncbi:MAG: protein kinase domain-containing protein [Aureliella sp.]
MESSNSQPDSDQLACPGTCPPPARLRDWLADRTELSESEIASVNSCSRCQALLEKISAEPSLASFSNLSDLESNSFENEPEFQAISPLPLPRFSDNEESIESNFAGNSLATPVDDRTVLETADHRDASTATESERLDSLNAAELRSQLPGSRYEVQRVIASGGSGSVFLGYDTQLSREVAIKVLSRNSMRDRQRFQREAKLLADIDHPNIVRIFDFGTLDPSDLGTESDRQFLVMEFMSGGTVRRLGGDPVQAPGTEESEFKRLAELLAGAADGLGAIHERGLVHRDIKPSNLLLTQDRSSIKLADFGLAKFADAQATQLTRTGDVIGTPEFMSPEQVSPDGSITAATDIYGLGATLYFIATETVPFKGNPTAVIRQVADVDPIAPRILNPSFPADLETICLKAMEKEPNNRYLDSAALAADLRRFANGEPITARPISNLTRTYRHLKRNPALGFAVTTCAVLGLLLVVGSMVAATLLGSQNRQLIQALEDAQTSEAESKYALQKSIEAADQLLVSVARDTEFLPNTPGSQEVSRKLLEKARSYFQSFLDTNSQDPQLLFELARAQAGLAEIAHRLGEPETVEKETQEALTVLNTLPPLPPEQEFRKYILLADTLVNFGNYQYDAGEAEEAIKSLKSAAEICDAALQDPSSDSVAVDQRQDLTSLMALALRGLGDAEIVAGKADQAIEHFGQAKDLFRNLLQESPTQTRSKRDAAMVEMSLATTAIDRGELTEGKQFCLNALQLLDQVADNDAGSLRVMELKGVAQTNLGLSERRMGNTEAAQAAYDFAIAQHKTLVALEPSVVGHKWNLVTATLNSGGPMLDRGEMEPLIERWRTILPTLDSLIQAEPETMRYRQVQAMLQSNIAIVLRDIGKLEEAIEPLQAATLILAEQSERVGNSPEAYLPVALNHYELAATFLQLERFGEALAALDDSDSVTDAILSADQDFTPALGHALDVRLIRFATLRASNAPPEVLVGLASSTLAIAQQLQAEQPDVEDYQQELPKALIDASIANRLAGDLKTASDQINSARDWFASKYDPQDKPATAELWKNILVEQARVLSSRISAADNESADELKSKLEATVAKAKLAGATDSDLKPESDSQ